MEPRAAFLRSFAMLSLPSSGDTSMRSAEVDLYKRKACEMQLEWPKMRYCVRSVQIREEIQFMNGRFVRKDMIFN